MTVARLLIVDDSPEIRSALRRIAEANDYDVVGEADNGKAALAWLTHVSLDVLLLDVSMPVMGGFETARRLKRIAPTLPILFISQHTEADYVDEAFRLGARGYLLKSAIASELGPALEAVRGNKIYRSERLAS
ncbi:MAG TPA: response regulator transcription factor [Bryobacteraceae bacterium]|nr:response regulator transcription factor [Bryobacteraceae bacterium]